MADSIYPDNSIDVTFNNVTITINASSPKEAYRKLCEALSNGDIEYATDTFATNGDGDGDNDGFRSVAKLLAACDALKCYAKSDITINQCNIACILAKGHIGPHVDKYHGSIIEWTR